MPGAQGADQATLRVGDGVVWTMPEAQALRWHDLEDGAIIFNRRTGESHYFNLYATYVLKLLAEGPLSEAQLRQKVAAGLSVPNDAELASRITRLIEGFEAIALIDQC